MTETQGNYGEGAPCWLEFVTSDESAATTFYGQLLGWEFDGVGEDGYVTARVRGKTVAGLNNTPEAGGEAARWNVYFATDDLTGAVKRATASGGQVTTPPTDVPNEGRFAVVRDPQGAHFRYWQAQGRPGAELIAEHGAPTWFELRTPDTGAAAEFYRAALDQPVESLGIPGFDYLTVRIDGNPVAGILGVPGETTRWTAYFSVSDTDAAVDRGTSAGGTVTEGPHDSPQGRVAWLVDPLGAEVVVISPPPGRG